MSELLSDPRVRVGSELVRTSTPSIPIIGGAVPLGDMVNRRANSDADISTSLPSVAPVVKRKRRASCLGEQERRERKRAIDREAQRSLREKTKTHIAELERTIEILRNQDRNGATASLLTEIEGLRAENERLRDVIDGVRSVIGGDVFGRMAPAASNATTATAGRQRQDEVAMGSPTLDAAGMHIYTEYWRQ